MSSVTVNYRSSSDVVETFDTNTVGAGKTTVPFNNSATLSSASSPSVTEAGYCEQALTAGAATIDLTALTTSRGRSMNLSGSKVRTFRVLNPSTNTGDITIATGAANGYTGFGASFSFLLKKGCEFLFNDNGGGVAVDATHKTLDLTGTGTDKLQFSISGGA